MKLPDLLEVDRFELHYMSCCSKLWMRQAHQQLLLACVSSVFSLHSRAPGPGTERRMSDKIIRILGLLCRIHPLMKSIQKQLSFFQMWLLPDACWLLANQLHPVCYDHTQSDSYAVLTWEVPFDPVSSSITQLHICLIGQSKRQQNACSNDEERE